MSCIYTYKGHTFNSEAELDDFIIEKLGYESKFGDAVFSKSTNFLRTKDIIENQIIKDAEKKHLQMEIWRAKRKASFIDDEELLDFPKPYIGVTRLLTKIRRGENRILAEFIADNYWDKRNESWTKPLKEDEKIEDRFSADELEIFFKDETPHLLNSDECKQLRNLMTKKWEFQAAAGTAIHYVLQQYFTKNGDTILGDSPRSEIFDTIKSKIDRELSDQMGDSKYRDFDGNLFNDKIINDALDYADELKVKLRKLHGDKCEFYPELSVQSKMATTVADEPDTVLGIIDLLVVDEKGQVNLYDYKTSPKPYDKFDSAKRLAYQYQLAMYGKLLKKYGLEYRKANISILPLQFENLELSNRDEALLDPKKAKFTYTGVHPSLRNFETDTKNKIFEVTPSGSEKILEVLDDYLPEEITYDVASEDLISEVTEQLKIWCPDYSKYKAKSEIEIHDMLEEGGYLKPVEREGKQLFIYQAKGAYSKEIIATSPEELISKVLKQQQRNEQQAQNFAGIVTNALEYGMKHMTKDIGKYLESIDSKSLTDKTALAKWFVEKLGIYCNGNWEIAKIPSINTLGIIALKNKKTNQIDIVKLSGANLYYNPFEYETKNGKRIKKRNHLMSYAFQSDIAETSDSNSLMLEGYKGNIEIMEVMLALNNIPSLFEGESGAVIGNIQIMNPFQGNGISAPNEQILYTFKKMCQLSPLKARNNVLEGNVKLGTTFDIGLNSFNEAMEEGSEYEINNEEFNSAKTELDTAIEHGDKEEKMDAILKILDKLEKAHHDLAAGKLTREMLLTKPYARFYNELLQAYRYLNGINLKQQIKDHDKWSEERSLKGIALNGSSGTWLDNPGNMLSDTLNTVAKLVTQAYQNIRNSMGTKVSKLRNATEELKKEKGFTGIAQGFGNATNMYENMTEVIGGDLLFTDLRSDKLSNAERKYLKLILEMINENRFGGIKSKKELESMRDSHDLEYYRVPLCMATAESRDSVIGLQKGLKERLKRMTPSNAIAEIKARVDGMFLEEDERSWNNAEELFKVNNRFNRSEKDIDYRLKAIEKNGAGYFERNLEVLTMKHCFAYSSAKELNKVFPIIKASMAYLSAAGNTVNKTFVKDEEYLEGYLKNSIKGQPLEENEKMQEATAVASKIKQIASFMALAFSPVQGMYQTIQGLWQDISLILRKPDGTNAFTWSNMWSAAKEVYSDMRHFSDTPTKCQLINEWLGVNDMDMNIYADRMRTDQHNKYNFVNFAFKFASRPDYYNRMTIIVAKMKEDGIWDALDVKDGQLVYDFKKDKRFLAYANGETTNPKYNDQRALYHAIAQQFITEGVVYPDGSPFQLSKDPTKPTPLPYAWTNQEGESIKALCDLIYGYYSHEKKSLIHATFLGSLYMQMKTYWSGKKNQYLAPGGVRIQGKWEQAIDATSGKPVYYQVDSNGMIDYDAPLTTDVTNAPFYQWKGQFQEGVIVTLSQIFRNGVLSKDALKNGLNEVWNNEDANIRTIRRANIKQFGFDMLFYGLISIGIAGLLLADWDKELQKEAKETNDLSDAIKATLAHLTRLSFGQSADDLNWWQSIGNPAVNWSPFSITQFTGVSKRFWNVLMNDPTFYDGITKSFAVGKQMKPIVEWLDPNNTN